MTNNKLKIHFCSVDLLLWNGWCFDCCCCFLLFFFLLLKLRTIFRSPKHMIAKIPLIRAKQIDGLSERETENISILSAITIFWHYFVFELAISMRSRRFCSTFSFNIDCFDPKVSTSPTCWNNPIFVFQRIKRILERKHIWKWLFFLSVNFKPLLNHELAFIFLFHFYAWSELNELDS